MELHLKRKYKRYLSSSSSLFLKREREKEREKERRREKETAFIKINKKYEICNKIINFFKSHLRESIIYAGSSECASRSARHDQRINRTGSADIKVC